MRLHRTLLILAGLGLVAALPARAHFGERTDSLWGFASRSDVVVIGTVLRSQRFEEKGHTTLPGGVRIRVEETLRGEARTGELGILIDGMHQPSYAEGERVLVFAERRDGFLRSLQGRSEKVSLDGVEDPAIGVVRRYAALAAEPDERKRLAALKRMTLGLLRSPVPRLHQDAVYDLTRKGLLDAHLTDADVAALGDLALGAATPLVVREGIAHKLGLLLDAGREAALAPLRRLAVEPGNAVVRVAALHALRRAPRAEARSDVETGLAAKSPHVRRAAVEALAAIGDAGAVAALERQTADPDARVRFEAIRALARSGHPEAAGAVARLERSPDPEIRRALAHTSDAQRRGR